MNRWLMVAVLIAATPCLGAVPEPDAYRLDHYRGPVPDTLRGATVVHTAALPQLIAAEHPVLIDVLPSPAPPADARAGLPRMPVPHKDIPGSIWLPEVGRGELSPQTEAWFKAHLGEATHGDKTTPVVFYCLSNCWMSWNATRRAVAWGYAHAYWYPEGADGWEAAGHDVQGIEPQK